jgi:DNA-binding CsgD family transcriptional regulator
MRHFVPVLHPSAIPRPRLLDQLAAWRHLRLIQVTAPAGFGKTWLATAWVNQLEKLPADQRPACRWLSLQPGDGTPEIFLHHLIEALLPLAPELAATRTLAAGGEKSDEQCVHDIAHSVQNLARPTVLVIDDFHLLDAPAVALVQQMIDLAPSLHLLLLSRTQPLLDLTTLIVRSTCLIVDAGQMRFDHAEFEAFSRSNALAQLTTLDRSHLEQRADGWFAGLQLLLHAHVHDDLLDRFIGVEILRPLPPAVLDFLTDVCPLPQLDPGLCAAATGRSAAECTRLLHTASQLNALITPFHAPEMPQDDRIKFRLHPLLQESLLRRRISSDTFTDEIQLRSRAAHLLARNGRVDDALAFLKPEQRQDRIAIIASAMRPALLRHEIGNMRRWMTQLPDTALSQHPQLAVDAAWFEYFAFTASVRSAIERARAALAATNADTDELRAELQVLDAIYTWVEVKPDHARALADEARRMPHAPIGIAAGYLCMLDAYVPPDPHDGPARVRALQTAADIFERAGYPHGAAEAASTQGFVKWRAADGNGAIGSLEHALALMQVTGWAHSHAATEAAFACGELLWHTNRIADARAMLQQARDICNRHKHPSLVAFMAEICLQMCDRHSSIVAQTDSRDGQTWAEVLTSRIPIAVGMAGTLRILRDYQAHRIDLCVNTLESIGIAPSELEPSMPDLLCYAVLSGCIYTGRTDEATETALHEFRSRMADARNFWMTLRADVLRTVLLLATERADAALAQLTETLPFIERSGMHRLVLDHPDLLPLLERCPLPYAQFLLDAANHSDAARRRLGLTAAERRIMKLLAADHTPKQMAEEMFVTVDTVRGHIQNCYRKLGVHNRAEALAVARTLGIA